MISRINYFTREAWANIRRSVTLTVASVLTVAVAVLFVGGTLLARDAVENSTARWQDGVEFIVFLQPDIPGDQVDSLAAELQQHPDIASFTYFDKDMAFEEFKSLLPEFTNDITPDMVPTSFRVVPRKADGDLISSLARQFEVRPGVYDVVSAQESVRQRQELGRRINQVLLVIAGIVAVASVLLIYNSIRVAMFARRREVEVMKLVGATNSFIRFPFVIEGMVHGLLGAVVGSVLLWSFRPKVEGLFNGLDKVSLFEELRVTSGQFQGTIMLVLLCGLLLGALGSAFAVGRFLDV